jgi:hypothetical protein
LLQNDSFVFGTKPNKYGMSRNLMFLVAQLWLLSSGQNQANMARPET